MKSINEIAALKNNQNRVYILTAITLLVLFSWFDFFDKMSTEYVDNAIVQGTITFGTARAFNAAISVLQSIQVGIFGSSVTIGEMLDPINDLVEQFSTLMKYALGSLIIQKLLLEIVSEIFFKVLISISGAILIFTTFMRNIKHFNVAMKIFVFMLFLRYIVILAITMNAAVDNAFIEEKFQKNIQTLESYNIDFESISNITDKIKAFKTKISELVDKMNEAVPTILNLMALFTFRVMILPLIFLYLFLKGFKFIWGIELKESFGRTIPGKEIENQ
jgi:hypothetical protein